MTWNPSKDKGSAREINPKALCYRGKNADGSEFFITVPAWENHPNGLVKGILWHPRYGSEAFDNKESRLTSEFEPVLALTLDDVPGLVKAVTEEVEKSYGERIESLERELLAVQEKLDVVLARAGQPTTAKPEPDEPGPSPIRYECRGCDKVYTSQGGLAYHYKTNPGHLSADPAAPVPVL